MILEMTQNRIRVNKYKYVRKRLDMFEQLLQYFMAEGLSKKEAIEKAQYHTDEYIKELETPNIIYLDSRRVK